MSVAIRCSRDVGRTSFAESDRFVRLRDTPMLVRRHLLAALLLSHTVQYFRRARRHRALAQLFAKRLLLG